MNTELGSPLSDGECEVKRKMHITQGPVLSAMQQGEPQLVLVSQMKIQTGICKLSFLVPDTIWSNSHHACLTSA